MNDTNANKPSEEAIKASTEVCFQLGLGGLDEVNFNVARIIDRSHAALRERCEELENEKDGLLKALQRGVSGDKCLCSLRHASGVSGNCWLCDARAVIAALSPKEGK